MRQAGRSTDAHAEGTTGGATTTAACIDAGHPVDSSGGRAASGADVEPESEDEIHHQDTRGGDEFRALLAAMQRRLGLLQRATVAMAGDEGRAGVQIPPEARDRLVEALSRSAPELRTRAAVASRHRQAERARRARSTSPRASGSSGARTSRSGEATAEAARTAAASSPDTEALYEQDAGRDLVEVERLRARLALAREENTRLRARIGELEALAAAREPQADDKDVADGFGTLETVEQVLAGHERCQAQQHELWTTVRTLQLFVHRLAAEGRALRVQRDEAEQAAERAWAANTRLAGSRNPQQRIRYLQQVKADNSALRRQVHELQALVAELGESASVDTGVDDEGPAPRRRLSAIAATLARCDARFERPRNDALRAMWARREALQLALARLADERRALAQELDNSLPGLSPRSYDGQSPAPSGKDAARAAPRGRIAHALG